MSEKKKKNSNSKPIKEEVGIEAEVIQEDSIGSVADSVDADDSVAEIITEIEATENAEAVAEETIEEKVVEAGAELSGEAVEQAVVAEETVEERDQSAEAEAEGIVKAAVSVADDESRDEESKPEANTPGDVAVTVSEEIAELPGAAAEDTADKVDTSVAEGDSLEEKAVIDTTVTAELTQTEGDLVSHEKDTVTEAPKPDKKSKEPSKFALFVKKHKLIFIIAAIVLVLAAAGTATFFILTKDIVYIRSAEDLIGADKGNLLVFKADVTVDGDITLDGYSFDMNAYTLTVNGTLTINGDANQTINIGNKKRKEFLEGGTIKANTIVVNGTTSALSLRSKAEADIFRINTSAVELYGAIKGFAGSKSDIIISNAARAAAYSAINGNVELGSAVDLDFFGSADKITGGKTVTAYDGAVSGLIEDSQKAVLYPESSIDQISNVSSVVFVEYLKAPDLLIIKEGSRFVCYISEVQNADYYDYSIDGQTGRVDAADSSFLLPILSPGRYNLSVTAGSTNESYNSAKATATASVHYTVKLDKPVVRVEEAGGVVNLVIEAVDHATEYVYSINGKEYSPVNAGTVNIAEKVQNVGQYTVYVFARNTVDSSYEQSDTVMTSYVNRVTLILGEISVTDNGDGSYTADWSAVANSNYYMIDEGGVVTYTRATSYTFSASSITITAKGTGYYVDSIPVLVNAPQSGDAE